MTMISQELAKCAVCGKGNEVSIMTSTCHFGACDLDTRPPAMFRFTIFLQKCSHCGYVNYDITEGNSSTKEFLDTDMYKTCDGINPASEEAKEYIQYALIQAHNKVETIWNAAETESSQEDVFWGFLNAAWACDDAAELDPDEECELDEEDEEYEKYKAYLEQLNPEKCRQDAIECRKRCLDLINGLIVKQEDTEKRETLSGIKADLLRRTGQFDAVIAEYENKVFQNPYVDQVVRFEIDLAKTKDTKCYSMDHIDPVKYPLKGNQE